MDLERGKEGGTWLGMTTGGKFAAITNYRQAPKFIDPNAIGRGHLVPDFLRGDDNVESYLGSVSNQSEKYMDLISWWGNCYKLVRPRWDGIATLKRNKSCC